MAAFLRLRQTTNPLVPSVFSLVKPRVCGWTLSTSAVFFIGPCVQLTFQWETKQTKGAVSSKSSSPEIYENDSLRLMLLSFFILVPFVRFRCPAIIHTCALWFSVCVATWKLNGIWWHLSLFLSYISLVLKFAAKTKSTDDGLNNNNKEYINTFRRFQIFENSKFRHQYGMPPSLIHTHLTPWLGPGDRIQK